MEAVGGTEVQEYKLVILVILSESVQQELVRIFLHTGVRGYTRARGKV